MVGTLGGTGCIKRALVNGQIEGTREASAAFDTIGDWELAYKAAASGIVQFEGMLVLSPGNEDALFMLAKAWTGYAYAFVEDDLEEAQDAGDRSAAELQRQRATLAYGRAVDRGLELIARRAKGWDEARKGEAPFKAWLAKNFTSKDDAGILFWTGYAWLSKTNLNKDDAEMVAELWLGVAMVERSVELDAAYNHHTGQTTLAAYHARSPMAEPEDAKALFETALGATKRQSLIVLVNYATKYACAKVDVDLYQKLLKEALTTPDSDPELRLSNAVARRRARRWSTEKRMSDACGMDAPPPAAS
jgi:hypothetical protein